LARPKNITRIECYGTSIHGGENTPVWLGPSTFDNPYPVHVHRHLGIITSRFLKELGRPMELFCRTGLLPGTTATLIAPDETVQGATAADPPLDQVARVVEFETPAQILCDRNVLAPDKYKTAYFDIVSTGFVCDTNTGGSLRFHFRIVGSPSHQQSFRGLAITLGQKPDGTASMTVQLQWNNTSASFVVGVQLTLQQLRNKPDGTKAAVMAHLLRSDGTRDTATGLPQSLVLATPTKDAPGLFVSVEATARSSEFWSDVSLLHSSNDNEYPSLDFDWLFSPGSDAEPSASVLPQGLNTMKEVQARVITVSPPIPLS